MSLGVIAAGAQSLPVRTQVAGENTTQDSGGRRLPFARLDLDSAGYHTVDGVAMAITELVRRLLEMPVQRMAAKVTHVVSVSE
ncbi:hypothetical protein [Mycolicibacterium fluoranthenivorans]|uniref:hypothetical protein n=1 Tax=Mycolicibacterium fluoranthenivorans TaxID=258505 RepID=UPI000B854071|nr:hypothetical protein [Mycolicibacterium fluoranthenivorans]